MKAISLIMFVTLAMGAGYAETASAQTRGGGYTTSRGGGGSSGGGGGSAGYESGGGRGSIVRLVTNPEVEQDLALTQEQKDALKAISQKVKAYEKRMFAERTGPPRAPSPHENRQWHIQKYEGGYQMLAGARQEIAKTLTPSQMKRLEQISLQDLGAEALFRPDIAQALNLSQEQRQKLAQIRDETGKELFAMAQRFQQNFLPEGMRPAPRGSGQSQGSAPSQRQFGAGSGATASSGTSSSGGGFGKVPPGGVLSKGSASGGGSQSGGGTFVLTPAQQKMIDEDRVQRQALVQESERRMIDEILTTHQQAKLKELHGKPCPLPFHDVSRAGGSGGGK